MCTGWVNRIFTPKSCSKHKITLIKVVGNDKTTLKIISAKSFSAFAELVFKFVFSLKTTFTNVILRFELALSSLSFC